MRRKLKNISVLLLIVLILVAIKNYRGIPIDCIGKAIEKEVTTSDFAVINGVEILGNQYQSVLDDAYIVFNNNDHIRTIIIDVIDIETFSDNMMCTVWYGTDQDGFWEMNSVTKELKSGVISFVIPYDGKYSQIRIDFGEQAGEFATINSIRVSDKFADWQNYIKEVLLVTLFLEILYALALLLKRYKEQLEVFDKIIWEKFIYPFRRLYEDIHLFCIRNKKALQCLVIFALILYGGFAFNYTLSIDEENNQTNSNEYLHYISTGRFTLSILIKFFGNSPFFNTIVGGIMMYLAAVMLTALLDRYKECTQFSCFVTCGLFMSMPYVIGETLNFAMQGMHTALGYILVACALYLFSYINLNKSESLSLICWGILFLVLSVGIYQSFVTVYIFLVAGLTLLLLKTKENIKGIIRFVVENIFFLIITMVIYISIVYLCHKFIIPDNGYLNGFVGWNKTQSNQWVWQNVVSNSLKIVKGEYYNQTGGAILKISVLLYAIYGAVMVWNQKRGKKFLMAFVMISVLFIPFIISLVNGSFIMLGRSLNALPILEGFIWYLIFDDISKWNLGRVAGKIAVTLLLIFQVKCYNEFVYADQLRYQQDIMLAGQIMEEVDKIVDDPDKPLVFVGTHYVNYRGNLSNVNGCESFFAFGTGDNLRILNFLNLSGYNVLYPSQEQINDAVQNANELPRWPKTGCIQDRGDYILIKLGNV